jgi:transcriptional regulator with XRE-family HTH domain
VPASDVRRFFVGGVNEHNLNLRAALRLRVAREAAGLSQKQLAERAGLSRPSLANIEAGRQTICLRTLQVLALALGIPASDLIA